MAAVHKITFSAVRIELTQSLSRQCGFSLQRLLPLSPGKHQAYKTYYLYFKKLPRSYKSPHQVELIQGGSTIKEAFFQALIFWFSSPNSH